MQLHKKDLKPGDVLMTNSPHAGGSYVFSLLAIYISYLNSGLATSQILQS